LLNPEHFALKPAQGYCSVEDEKEEQEMSCLKMNLNIM
jgi:hypothetical protein